MSLDYKARRRARVSLSHGWVGETWEGFSPETSKQTEETTRTQSDWSTNVQGGEGGCSLTGAATNANPGFDDDGAG